MSVMRPWQGREEKGIYGVLPLPRNRSFNEQLHWKVYDPRVHEHDYRGVEKGGRVHDEGSL